MRANLAGATMKWLIVLGISSQTLFAQVQTSPSHIDSCPSSEIEVNSPAFSNWQWIVKNEDVRVDQAGEQIITYKIENAKALRVELSQVALQPTQKLLIKDKNGVEVEHFTDINGEILSEYVLGDTIYLEFINEDASLPLNLRIDTVQFSL